MSTSNETHRCSICDRTNNYDLCTYPEQYTPGPFRLDPHNFLNEICMECDDAVYETLEVWNEDDEED